MSVIDSSFADGQPTSIRSMSSIVELAEVDLQRAVLPPEGEVGPGVARGVRPEVGRHPVAEPVPVPRHDPRALPGVGRREPLADERVEQRRLAGLDAPGDGDPQRLVQAPDDRVDGRGLLGALGGVAGEVGDRPDLGREIAVIASLPRREVDAVAGSLLDGMVGPGDEDAHLGRPVRLSLTWYSLNGTGPAYSSHGPLPGTPASSGGTVSKKKWTWRPPGSSGV